MFSIEKAAEHLSRAVQFPTVSYQDPKKMDAAVFSSFETFLEESYPLLHQKLSKRVINGHGLLFHWPGKSSDKSVLLTAHYDVVPADAKGWPFPPFSGQIHEGKVYGRGSFDDKSSLIAILEAVTACLEEELIPAVDIYLAFGFDEEVGGAEGAAKIAEYFEEEGLRFDFVLDEGGAVADGSMMGISKPVAVIGIAEKGNSSFRLQFHGEGGHSSTPPAETAVSEMARFIREVQAHPQRPHLTETVKAMLKATAPYHPGIQRFILAQPDLFEPLLVRVLMKNRQTAAMLRTTTAFTMAEGGISHNVLPTEASCTLNLRILQGDSIQKAIARLESFGIPFELSPIMREEATKASDLESKAMEGLRRSIARIFPDAVITPYLMVGSTDCRHYEKVARNSYRFQPVRVSEKELALMHGKGEYLSLDNLETMVSFYRDLIKNLS